MTETTPTSIRPKDRDSILQSLRAGVIPKAGIQHIQVGRVQEIKALLRDIERIKDGGSAMRLVIGDYGAGKTFFLHLVRTVALKQGLVTINADLSPERRLYSTSGQARALYAEMMHSLSTRTKSDGGGLPSVVERFISIALQEAKVNGQAVDALIRTKLADLTEMTAGYDFAEVIAAYWRGHNSGNDMLKADAAQWLRGEYTNKTAARQQLGVRTIIDDATIYEHLKLLSRFVRHAGYQGLLVIIDEMVNLYKLSHVKSRQLNYEQILRILNDTLQGSVEGLGVLMGGTPEFLLDSRKGLYSYPALQSRLAENSFAANVGVTDFQGPIIRLTNLTPEDLYILLTKLRHVQAGGEAGNYLVPDAALQAFLTHCANRIGDAYFRTPRTTIKAFLDFLAVLEQNPQFNWQQLLTQVTISKDTATTSQPATIANSADKTIITAATTEQSADDLADFKL